MRRWTSTYDFAWTPIITFDSRKQQFLQWVEDKLQPLAFNENDEGIGIALGSRGTRLTITRNGATLRDSGGSPDGVKPLFAALDGVIETLDPKSVVLRALSTASSEKLETEDYDHARNTFARLASGLGRSVAGLAVHDASILLDLVSEDYTAQLEWGVVSAPELMERLGTPTLGRASGSRPSGKLSSISAEALPTVSLFIDTLIKTTRSTVITDRAGMEAAMNAVDVITAEVTTSIAGTFAQELGKNA